MNGHTVHWENEAYVVEYAPDIDDFLIRCVLNATSIGLTWQDDVTMNGREDQFFIASKQWSFTYDKSNHRSRHNNTKHVQNSITPTPITLIHNQNIHIYPLCTFL